MNSAQLLFQYEVRKTMRDCDLSYDDAFYMVSHSNSTLYNLANNPEAFRDSIPADFGGVTEQTRQTVFACATPALKELLGFKAIPAWTLTDFDAAILRVRGNPKLTTEVTKEIVGIIQNRSGFEYDRAWDLVQPAFPELMGLHSPTVPNSEPAKKPSKRAAKKRGPASMAKQ